MLPIILDYMKEAVGEREAGKYSSARITFLSLAGTRRLSILQTSWGRFITSRFCWLIMFDEANRSDSAHLSEVVRSYNALSKNKYL